MVILSTNIAKPETVEWRGKKVKTGIFKIPVRAPLYLERFGVKNDTVADLKAHGGLDKACYLFSYAHYPYWKNLYSALNWQYGMFGENLTISDFDESKIHIGDIFRIGETIVQVTQPRQPCFKLGIRFNNQHVLRQFIEYGYPGAYVRILKEGNVKNQDEIICLEKKETGFTLTEIFKLLYQKNPAQILIEKAVTDEFLAESCKKDLLKKLSKI